MLTNINARSSVFEKQDFILSIKLQIYLLYAIILLLEILAELFIAGGSASILHPPVREGGREDTARNDTEVKAKTEGSIHQGLSGFIWVEAYH